MPALLITLAVPLDGECLRYALEALTAIDCAILISGLGDNFPDLYESHVRYQHEPPGRERWLNVGELLHVGAGDCEDLACWRAAELRVRHGEHAFARPVRGGPNTIHIVVERGDGSIEDPSRMLGMEVPVP